MNRLTSEFRLAASVCWLPPEAQVESQRACFRELCRQVTDWAGFLALVDRHRLPALAHANLAGLSQEVPGNVLEALQQRSRRTKIESLKLTTELVRLAKKFEAASIPVLPLKGQLLSFQLYGDPAVRHSRDLDLLVQFVDLKGAQELLIAEGYLLESLCDSPSPAQTRFIHSVAHHLVFQHPERVITLELHWNCDRWSDEEMCRLWDGVVTTRFFGVDFHTLSRELQLLQLCDHGSKHQWSRLKWLGDIARILADGTVSCESLLNLAGCMDRVRCIGQGALLAEKLCGVSLPSELASLANEPWSKGLAQEALNEMLSSEAAVAQGGRGKGLKLLFYTRRMRPSLPLVCMVGDILVSSQDFKLIRLPDSCFWMYVVLRPFTWFWRSYPGRWIRKQTRHGTV